jgi:large subunit ribosomal protein L9
MKKDYEKVGMAGQLVDVSRGFAENHLIPSGYSIRVYDKDIKFYKSQSKQLSQKTEIIASNTSMLAERLKNTHITIKAKAHDDGKLYGAITASDLLEPLKEKGFSVSKKQIEFTQTIKSIGQHVAVIKLSSKLKPEITIKIVEEKNS